MYKKILNVEEVLVNYHGGTSWNNIFNLLPIFRGLWMSR
jgi:hypothetical protein